MEIRKASVQGFCFGVAITVKKAEEAIASRGDVTTLGHVVHNPQMVESLAARGLKNAQTRRRGRRGALFVRAHGLPVDVFEKAAEKNLEIIDATCPMVTKIHVQAEKLKADGYKIIVIGDPNHPEVKGTLSHVPGAWCIQTPDRRRTAPALEPRRRRRAVDLVGRRLHARSYERFRRSTTKCAPSTRSAPIRTIVRTKRCGSPKTSK